MKINNRKRRVNNYNTVVVICEFFSITEEEFFSKSRKRTFVLARQIAMYIMRHHGNVCTFAGIKDFFKSRNSISNHATVLYNVKAIDQELEYNKDLQEQVDIICEKLCILNRHYIDIYWFMNVEKGNKLHLQYGLDTQKNILWEHDSIQRRGGRLYIKGKYKKGEQWVERDDMMYEEDGFICAGDGYKVYASGNKVLV
tara:strand:+ start:4282 stop:4875 length:594 start_codon:yes stop_codon:yes gene_type:complete